MLLAGDLGGTKTLLGVFDDSPGRPLPRVVREFATLDYDGLAPMVAEFLRDAWIEAGAVTAATIGVAGPVKHRAAWLTNVPWRIDASELQHRLGLGHVELVNDVEAMAWAVPTLTNDEIAVLQAGVDDPEGNALLMTAGTGLGHCFLHRVGPRLVPMASEGGHADFAARTDREVALARFLSERVGRVDVEAVVSGRGIGRIAEFTHGGPCPLAPPGLELADYPAHVSGAAMEDRCRSCAEAFDIFLEAFGSVVGSVAILAVARGGVFLGGGIPPKILDALADGRFIRAFRSKPPMEGLLADIPVKVMLDARAGLSGAAIHAASWKSQPLPIPNPRSPNPRP